MPPPVALLTERVRSLFVAGVGELATSSMRVANQHYTDPAILAAELASSFTAPLLLCASSSVASPGDYTTLTVISTPLLVTRDPSGTARVFVNACRHRGAQVAEGDGCARRFTCPYHRWVYDSSGDLVGQTGGDGFDDLDPAQLGLVELPSGERHGFIWATVAPDAPFDLDAHLGPFDAELAAWGLEYATAGVMELDVAANWKSGLEAFQETYHFPYVHAGSMVASGAVGNITSFDQFGRHHRLGLPLSHMARPAEVDGASDSLAEGQNTGLVDMLPMTEEIGMLYYIYPCTVIAVSPFGGELLQFWPSPTDPGRSVIRHSALLRQSLDEPGMRELAEFYVPLIQSVVRDEDCVVIESAGKALRAGRTDVILGRNEIGCQMAHQQILADLRVAEVV